MSRHEKLLEYTLESAQLPERKHCGSRYPLSIGSAPFAIVIFGQHTVQCYPASATLAVGKETGKTNYIERFSCTISQRISRLVRKTLSFSKKLDNSFWSNLVLHSSLQCILTCLGLPKSGFLSKRKLKISFSRQNQSSFTKRHPGVTDLLSGFLIRNLCALLSIICSVSGRTT